MPASSPEQQPVVTFRPATENDFVFVEDLHRTTLKDHVEKIWGWNEAQQYQLQRERFDPAGLWIIQVNARDVGILKIDDRGSEIFLAAILLLPDYQNQGIGSALVRDVMQQADSRGISLSLSVLKPNPAKAFYERLGFRVVGDDHARNYMQYR